ncbi:MAG: tyrosine-type recombinase/integrase [Candidatus Heimdallarchaeota archaeon]
MMPRTGQQRIEQQIIGRREGEKLKEVLKMRISLNEIEKYIAKFASVRRWFEKIEINRPLPLDIESSTVRHYMSYLIKFCKWLGKSPDEIIEERLRDKKSQKIAVLERYEQFVRRFSLGYKQCGKPVAAREAVVALKSFFKHNFVPLLIKSPRKIIEKERTRLTIEEIRAILNFCDVREKAFVLLMLQTGARPLQLLRLTYRDIKEDFESKNLPIRVKFSVFDVKGNYGPYTALLGKDAYEALADYFKIRRHGTEKVEPEEITDQSPLMRKFSSHEAETYAGLYRMCKKLTRIAHMLGINKNITPYTFRRTFQTIMEQHMPVNWVDRLMGHVRFRGIQGEAYSQPTVEELAEAYKKAEPYISISNTKEVNSKQIGAEVLNHIAKIYGINLNKIFQRKKSLSLYEMSEDDIIALYHEFRRLIKKKLQAMS